MTKDVASGFEKKFGKSLCFKKLKFKEIIINFNKKVQSLMESQNNELNSRLSFKGKASWNILKNEFKIIMFGRRRIDSKSPYSVPTLKQKS